MIRFCMTLLVILFATRIMASEPLRLNLEQALLMASQQNPHVLIAKTRVQGAIARIGQARSAVMPQINGLVNGSRQVRDLRSGGFSLPGAGPSVGPFNSFDSRVRLSVDLFNPSTVKRLQASIKSKEATVAEMDKTKEDILALVANMYLDAKRARQHLNAVERVYQREKQAFDKAQRQFDQGIINDVELLQAKASFEETRFLVSQAQVDEKEQRLNLLQALGVDGDVPIFFKKDAAIKNVEQDIVAPNVRLAIANVNEAQAQVSAAKAGLLPQIEGVADIGYAGKDFNNSSRVYTVGLQAIIPFWQGGLTQAQIQEAKSHQEGMTIALDDAKRQSHNDKDIAQGTINQAKGLMRYRYVQLLAANKMLATSERRFNEGLIEEVGFKEALAIQVLAKDDYQDALAFYQMAQIKRAHSQGKMETLFHGAKPTATK